jgi:hypothetical protein
MNVVFYLLFGKLHVCIYIYIYIHSRWQSKEKNIINENLTACLMFDRLKNEVTKVMKRYESYDLKIKQFKKKKG